MNKIKKLLVANRGEIAIRCLRAASELEIKTVAVYTYEDRYSLHRYKADEAYQIGHDADPLKPYLDIEEIIRIAKKYEVDAIHPGYGFLSENVNFNKRCREAGIVFIGPSPDAMNMLGDKVAAKKIAQACNVPMIEDSKISLTDSSVALSEAQRIGLPVILKAAAGGGGRGMRVIRNEEDLEKSLPKPNAKLPMRLVMTPFLLKSLLTTPSILKCKFWAMNLEILCICLNAIVLCKDDFRKLLKLLPLHHSNKKQKMLCMIMLCALPNMLTTVALAR